MRMNYDWSVTGSEAIGKSFIYEIKRAHWTSFFGFWPLFQSALVTASFSAIAILDSSCSQLRQLLMVGCPVHWLEGFVDLDPMTSLKEIKFEANPSVKQKIIIFQEQLFILKSEKLVKSEKNWPEKKVKFFFSDLQFRQLWAHHA